MEVCTFITYVERIEFLRQLKLNCTTWEEGILYLPFSLILLLLHPEKEVED